MIRAKLFGDWEKAKMILNNSAGVTRAIHRAVLMEAQQARRDIVIGIRDQAPAGQPFQQLAPLTLALRKAKGFRGTKALIVTGSLLKAITVKSVGPGRAFVGVLRSARGPDGRELVNVARINEFGATFTIRVTPRMRRYIMFLMRKYYGKQKSGKLQGRDKKTGRYLKGTRWSPSGRGNLSKGAMVIRIPPRPFIRPVIQRILDNPTAARDRLTRRIAIFMKLSIGKP